MKTTATELPGVLLIDPVVYGDERGSFLEVWHAERYRAAGVPPLFVQANQARSRHGVLRGLHFQLEHPQAKLVWAASGEIFDAAVDVRAGSPTFGRWTGAVLSAENRRQIFVPAGFAHGYCVLSESADVVYLCSDHYRPDDERGIAWNDPEVGVAWPVIDPVVSAKDRGLPPLGAAELPQYAPPAKGARR